MPGSNDAVVADHHPDREPAIPAANAVNSTFRQALSARDPIAKRSLELKIDKALQDKQSLQDAKHECWPKPRAVMPTTSGRAPTR